MPLGRGKCECQSTQKESASTPRPMVNHYSSKALRVGSSGPQPCFGTESCPVLHCALIVSSHFPSLGVNFLASGSLGVNKILSKPCLILLSSFFDPYTSNLQHKNPECSNGDRELRKARSLEQVLSSRRWRWCSRPLAAAQGTSYPGPP